MYQLHTQAQSGKRGSSSSPTVPGTRPIHVYGIGPITHCRDFQFVKQGPTVMKLVMIVHVYRYIAAILEVMIHHCLILKAGLLHYPENQNCWVSFRGPIWTFVPTVATRPATQQAGYNGQSHENDQLYIPAIAHEFKGHLSTESEALLFKLDRPKPGASSQVELDIKRILTLRATQL